MVGIYFRCTVLRCLKWSRIPYRRQFRADVCFKFVYISDDTAVSDIWLTVWYLYDCLISDWLWYLYDWYLVDRIFVWLISCWLYDICMIDIWLTYDICMIVRYLVDCDICMIVWYLVDCMISVWLSDIWLTVWYLYDWYLVDCMISVWLISGWLYDICMIVSRSLSNCLFLRNIYYGLKYSETRPRNKKKIRTFCNYFGSVFMASVSVYCTWISFLVAVFVWSVCTLERKGYFMGSRCRSRVQA
jgi:hypothetical protein